MALQGIVASEAFDVFERNGRSTRIHAVVEGKGRPLHVVLTGGQAHDNHVVGRFLQATRPALRPSADKAHDSKRARQQIFGPRPKGSLR